MYVHIRCGERGRHGLEPVAHSDHHVRLEGVKDRGKLQQTQAGGLGRIRVTSNSLVVWNTIEVHEMIAGQFVMAR